VVAMNRLLSTHAVTVCAPTKTLVELRRESRSFSNPERDCHSNRTSEQREDWKGYVIGLWCNSVEGQQQSGYKGDSIHNGYSLRDRSPLDRLFPLRHIA